MGGAVIDVVAKPSTPLILLTSNIGTMTETYGGVARNVVETMGRLLPPSLLPCVTFYSAVGSDDRGAKMKDDLDTLYGCKVAMVDVMASRKTASYLAVLDERSDLHTAVADMGVLRDIPVPGRRELEKVRNCERWGGKDAKRKDTSETAQT
jgi:pseudouridine kinase